MSTIYKHASITITVGSKPLHPTRRVVYYRTGRESIRRRQWLKWQAKRDARGKR